MKAKLKVGLTVRVEEKGELDLNNIRDLIRKYLKEGKFTINDVTLKTDYRDEVGKNENQSKS